MNWFDIFSILFVVLVVYIGSQRGFILEMFDFIILVIGMGITFNLYAPLAKFILSVLPGWDKALAYWFSFLLIFFIVGTVIIVVGLLINKAAKLAVVAKPLNFYGGMGIAFFKSFVLLWLILLLILFLPVSKKDRKFVFDSNAGKIVWGNNPTFTGIIDTVAPTFVAEGLEKMIKTNKP